MFEIILPESYTPYLLCLWLAIMPLSVFHLSILIWVLLRDVHKWRKHEDERYQRDVRCVPILCSEKQSIIANYCRKQQVLQPCIYHSNKQLIFWDTSHESVQMWDKIQDEFDSISSGLSSEYTTPAGGVRTKTELKLKFVKMFRVDFGPAY